VRQLLQSLGVNSVDEIRSALEAHRAAGAAGLGGALEAAAARRQNLPPADPAAMAGVGTATSSVAPDPQIKREIDAAAARASTAVADLQRLQAMHSAAAPAAPGPGMHSESNQLSKYLETHGEKNAVLKATLSKLSPAKAQQAPKLEKIAEHPVWTTLFIGFLGSVEAQSVMQHGSKYWRFPLVDNIGSQPGTVIDPSPAMGDPAGLSDEQRLEAALDLERLRFAYQALVTAVAKVPVLINVIIHVPSPNAPAAWARFKDFIQPQSAMELQAKVMALQRLQQHSDEELDAYYARAAALVSDVRSLGQMMAETIVVNSWVSGLRSATGWRRDMLRQKESLDKAYSAARLYESTDVYEGAGRRAGGVRSESAVTFAHAAEAGQGGGGAGHGRSNRDARIRCYNCNEVGHRKVNCPKPLRNNSRATKICSWCQNVGHTEAECRNKANGRPRAQPSANANEAEDDDDYNASAYGTEVTEADTNAAQIQTAGEGPAASGVKIEAQLQRAHSEASPLEPLAAAAAGVREVIIDSGANYHMVGRGTVLQNSKPASNLAIRTAGSQVLRNPQLGTAELTGSDGTKIKLIGAIQHDELNRDLISVSKILETPGVDRVTFWRESAKVVAPDGRVLAEAKNDGGLYKYLSDANVADVKESSAVTPTDSPGTRALEVQRIHERLGHPGQSMMLRLAQAGLGGLAGFKAADLKLNCGKCIEGKMTRLPYSRQIDSAHKAQAPLDRVHADLHGPVDPPSLGGSVYVLVIIDEFSSRIWVHLLKLKSDAASAIMTWATRISVQTGKWPKEFHTDGGGEFVNAELAKFWALKGVNATQTLPYTPQHNGMVERANRTLVDKARTMLVAAGAPRQLWADAIHAAAYLHNSLDVRTGQTKPPEQLFNRRAKPPSTEHIRVWGCDAYRHSDEKGKYSPKAVKGMFIGYTDLGYRILDPSTHKVYPTRHVKFDEGNFSAAAAARESLQSTDDAEDEDDETYYGRLTLANEIALAKLISLEDNPEADASDDEKEPQSEPPAFREGGMESPQPAAAEPTSPEFDGSPVPPTAPPMTASAKKRAREKAKKARAQEQEPTRTSTRARAPPARYGLTSPGDIAQGLLFALEEVFTADAFPAEGVKRRVRPVMQQEIDRLRAIRLCDSDVPFPPDRPRCNKNGELVTPSQQCTAPNSKGEQCRSKTCNGQYCWTHLKKLEKLRIKKSGVPEAGRGLFVVEGPGDGLPKGAFVSTGYHGDRSDDPDVDHGGSKYVFGATRDTSIDAARRNTAPTRLMNDPRRSGLSANCEWVVNPRAKTVRIRTTRDVRPGEELLIAYGADYWRREREVAREAKRAVIARKARGRNKVNASSAELIAVDAQHAASEPASVPQQEQLKFADHAPKSYAAARQSPEWAHWHQAILAEENSLRDKGVFKVVDALPKGFRPLDCKWVFAYKRDADGKIVRYKARLVARGFMQRDGIDYGPTFAPVVDGKTLKALMAIVAAKGLECKIMDVETAFLNAPLDEEIYIQVPLGFEGAEQGKFLRLNRALYGLKQAGRQWNHTLAQALRECGYQECTDADRCVFTKRARSGRLLYICTYVDDMPYAYDKRDEAEMEEDKQALMRRFSIKDLGEIRNVLGMRISRDRAAGTLTIDLAPYLERMLKDFGYGECRPELTPESTGQLSDRRTEFVQPGPASAGGADEPDEDARGITADNYAQAVGSLMYAANACRPDLAHVAGICARATSAPDRNALLTLRRAFRYVAGTLEEGLTYSAKSANPLRLVAYSDADWGGCVSSGKSTTGMALFLAGAVVDWGSRRQSIVALSSAEAEYIAASDTSREIIWMRRLLAELGYPQAEATPLFIDNSTAIHMTEDERGDARRKHINVRYHYIRSVIESNEISAEWVGTDQQLADIFTKPLQRPKFIELRSRTMGAEP